MVLIFSELGNYGRLGNVLFQYAALKGIANKLNVTPKIPYDIDSKIQYNQSCLLKCFKYNCSKYSQEEFNQCTKYNEQCVGGNYDQNLFNIQDNTNIFGSFESYLFWKNIENDIKNEYQLQDEYNNYGFNYINNIRNNYPEHQIIGLHIRRGDDATINKAISTTINYNQKYLNKAINCFSNFDKKVFLVFTGGSREPGECNNKDDINWCKENIPSIISSIILYSENNDTIHDFSIMIHCDHMIINSESTLGWWACYLNKNPNKIVVGPRYVLKGKNPDTYYPDFFTQINWDN